MLGAGIDLAFARDSSALVIAERGDDGTTRVVEMDEVRGGPASDPRVVVAAFAATLRRHRVTVAAADTHYRALLAPELSGVGVALHPAPAEPIVTYLHMARELAAGRVRIPPHPLRARLVQQLRQVRRRPTSTGAVSISHGRRGGGHGDLVAALVLAVWMSRPDQSDAVLRAPSRTAELFFAPEHASYGRSVIDAGDRWDGYDVDRWS